MGTNPFVKTWWFLEAEDGSWLADVGHELFTRDPNAALKWPNRTHADWARQRLHHPLWGQIRAVTEHQWPDEQRPLDDGQALNGGAAETPAKQSGSTP